jgi:hypothetical protein
MRIVELIIEEEEDSLFSGIDAISIVEHPAIEENFVALNQQKEYKLAEADTDKRLLTGALLIPNKTIYRKDGDDEYYIYFTRETVRKASEMFLMNGYQNNSTFEHKLELSGLSLVESWIVEDEVKDKSQIYDMDLPLGTWVGTMKVTNEEVWKDFVKTGKVKGFSIEGYFVEKSKKEELSKEIEAGLELLKIKQMILEAETNLESYTDYPESASNNAKRSLEWAEKNGWGSCGTDVGKQRANQLAKKEGISRDTISRMASFKRHQQNKDVPYSEGCGGLMWDAWGGTSGIEWAINKLKKLDEK